MIPYFGSWPFWINFFLESCRFNSSINWLIFTDCGEVENCPDNVEIRHITFSRYCQLVSEKLSIDFRPLKPYKLCDIKPAYGLIHENDLVSYDFWGYGDIDIVYGNIRQFLPNDRLASKDVFSMHKTRTSGHFCLIRNCKDLVCAFQKIPDWVQKFTYQQHLAIDEKDFSKLFLRHKNSPKFIKKLAAIVDPWLNRAEFIESYSTPNARIPWIDGTYDFPKRWTWKNGNLTNEINENLEFLYFHFYIWKKLWSQNEVIPIKPHLKTFSITKSGFEAIE